MSAKLKSELKTANETIQAFVAAAYAVEAYIRRNPDIENHGCDTEHCCFCQLRAIVSKAEAKQSPPKNSKDLVFLKGGK